MNNKLNVVAKQALIVLNVFALFLLLFSKYIVLPFWMQPLGRMHPALLHFPIVVLILGVILGLRRFTGNQEENTSFDGFARNLLLVGALLAGTTVIMGLFLSKEEGYAGEALAWHKWSGAAIFFLSSGMYWINDKPWFKKGFAWSSGIGLIGVILFTGHFGGVLSHGENFIMQPILSNIKKPLVPIEKAIVYDDIIHPIFAAKCASCHNLQKQKGELSFADSFSIKKGGKTGQLFVAGNPEISLLLERVHLPLDDEKHMPPSSKPQLSPDEINLLGWWIKNQASFTQKVMDLSPIDPLRLLASKMLKGPDAVEDKYDFSAADEKIIAKLNADYRVILPVAKESPGLDVRIYNKDLYKIQQVEELGEIKNQVVSLSLAKLPVKNEDLNKISMFENLRKLDINFTEVTTSGLAALSSLKYLHTLCLSGTKIASAGFKDVISQFKNLETVTLWSTSLSAQEITQLQKTFKNINFVQGFVIDETAKLKLNPPQVKNKSLVFSDSIGVALFHPINGTEIRYTIDGTEPDSISSPVFNNHTFISKTTNVKAKVYKQGWYSSDAVEFSFLKNTFVPDSTTLLSQLNSRHLAEGANTFFNKKLGVIGANNPAWANYWAAVRDNDLILECLFKSPITLSSFGMHIMVEEVTGIYPPKTVEIWGGDNSKNMRLITKISPKQPEKEEKVSLKFVEGVFTPRKVSYLKIVAKPTVNTTANAKEKDKNKKKKNNNYFILVDEMFLN